MRTHSYLVSHCTQQVSDWPTLVGAKFSQICQRRRERQNPIHQPQNECLIIIQQATSEQEILKCYSCLFILHCYWSTQTWTHQCKFEKHFLPCFIKTTSGVKHTNDSDAQKCHFPNKLAFIKEECAHHTQTPDQCTNSFLDIVAGYIIKCT